MCATEKLQSPIPNGNRRAISLGHEGEQGGAGEFRLGHGLEVGVGTHNKQFPHEAEKLVREVSQRKRRHGVVEKLRYS